MDYFDLLAQPDSSRTCPTRRYLPSVIAPISQVISTESPNTSQSAVQRSLDIYFDSFYPMFPILNQTRIRSQVANYVDAFHTNVSVSPSGTAQISTPYMLLESILALVESRETTAGEPNIPRLTRISNQSMTVETLNNLSVDTVMVALHLFVAYQSLGERLAAWYHLQQAMTLLLMLGPVDWTIISQNEEHLRLYWILCVPSKINAH